MDIESYLIVRKADYDQLEYVEQELRQKLDEANAKIAELERWKLEQLFVESEWDAQATAKLLGAKPGQSCRRVINQRVPELIAEIEAAEAAAVPLCIGRPIITILAEKGQWMSETGQGVVAADELFRNNPYDALDEANDDRLRLREALQWVVGKVDADKLVVALENIIDVASEYYDMEAGFVGGPTIEECREVIKAYKQKYTL